jgi:hypothetical protein
MTGARFCEPPKESKALAQLDEAEHETRIIRKVMGMKVKNPPTDDLTASPVLVVVSYAEAGPLNVRLTPTAARELLAVLSKHPLVGKH